MGEYRSKEKVAIFIQQETQERRYMILSLSIANAAAISETEYEEGDYKYFRGDE